jgi:two-component system, response regulator
MLRNRKMQTSTILLVEDNARDEALTLRAIKKNHLADNVIVTRNGVDAMNYLFGRGNYKGRDTSIVPKLIMLDLKMPKMDGLQVLKALRDDELTKRLPVVVFTSSSEQEDILKSYDLGANSYVRKPVDFKAFSEVIRQLGTYWLLMNEAVPSA